MGGREQEFIREAFDTNWIAPLGPNVNGFEQELQQYTGASHAAALSSGTAAIHLALILLNVKPGDLVICQSFTFSATANPIAYQGATPVFVDSEPATWNMDPEALEIAIQACLSGTISGTPQSPKAIIPVHLYGMPAKMNLIMAIAEKYGIPVVEDAAEALGSTLHGKKCGTFGNFGILSFNGNKIITTSGGGALLSEDGDMVVKARFLATQARDNAPHYQHSHIGYNYRMSNIVAGIGRGQLHVLDSHMNTRRKHFEMYRQYFTGLTSRGYNVALQPEPEGYVANRWLSTIIIDPEKNKGVNRDTLRLAFERENIESRPLWKPMHLQPVFEGTPFFGNGLSEKLFNTGLCLPSGSNLTQGEIERIFEVLDLVFS
jgi:dTDP-4-amino-4,6-dideoxygalactose transaminase